MAIKTIDDIKTLYKSLKKNRQILTWGEFADKIEYDRTYVSRVMNGHEPLTDEFVSRVNKEKWSATENVSRETTLETSIKDLEEWRVMMDAALGVIISELVPLVAKATGKSNAGVAAQLKKDIQDETQNRLAELKKGQRS